MGDAARGRQQDRARHRRAGRHGQHARERDDGAHGGAVVPASVRRRAKRIVCSAMDFPSMVHLYRAQQAAGFELRVVPAEDDLTVDTERMLDAIDETDRGRRLLARAVPHVVHHGRGRDRPRAHARSGRRSILDTYQSAGIIPVDVDRARRRLRGRRLPEVAVRRTRQRVPLHAARSADGGDAGVHRLAVAAAAVRLRHRRTADGLRDRRDAHDERDAVDSGATTRRWPGSTSSTRSASDRIRDASQRDDGARCWRSSTSTASRPRRRAIRSGWPARSR